MASTAKQKPGKAWWALAALLAVAVVVDVIDRQPLKLLTSMLLLAGCLLSALLPTPRGPAGLMAIGGCFGGAALLVLFRIATGAL